MTETNPLLSKTAFPAFDQIQVEHILPAVEETLANNRRLVAKLVEQNSATWDNLVQPLEEMHAEMTKMWSPVSHLHSVKDSPELRSAYEASIQLLSEFWTELGQNEALYKAYQSIAQSDAFSALDHCQQKVITNAIRDFTLAGVGLPPDEKKRYAEIQKRLSELSTSFSNHVLDATQAWHYHSEKEEELSGIPSTALASARATAEAKGLSGWVFTLDFPSYYAIMSYADNRSLRQTFYEAHCTRASELGPNAGDYDNSEVMEEILALRQELANLLGFKHYASYSLATKMADEPQEVVGFLKDLAAQTKPQAEKEYETLSEYAKGLHFPSLEAWDVAYVSEKLKKEQFDISQEALRPYFPIDKVLSGLFEVIQRLYGYTVEERNDLPTWHPDVRVFDLRDASKNLKGHFYLDLYARENKRGGAWMDDCQIQTEFKDGRLELPIAYLTCNFTAPVEDKPGLLTHDEVVTLFHETGHGLHHLLTSMTHPSISGINGVAWDAVELPSQFFENWCWEKEGIALISAHFETGEALPDNTIEKLKASKCFQSGMQMCRQLEFALFDFSIHEQANALSKASIQAALDSVREEVAVVHPPEYNRFQNSFSHIFAGGYAAGYYSYKWAEVLASDAFSVFEERGLFDAESGQSFLNAILSQGGSKDAMELFVEFRGRKPSVEPLLRHSGIST